MAHRTPCPLDITGLILAGGAGRRVGGQDKGLLALDGRPLIEWVIAALQPQCHSLMVSANRNQAQYQQYGYEVLPDMRHDDAGPLAGIERALNTIVTPWLLTSPCDTPWIPHQFGAWLAAALTDQPLAVVTIADRRQPLHALIHRDLAADLTAYLDQGGRKVQEWMAGYPCAEVCCDAQVAAFANLNQPGDWATSALTALRTP